MLYLIILNILVSPDWYLSAPLLQVLFRCYCTCCWTCCSSINWELAFCSCRSRRLYLSGLGCQIGPWAPRSPSRSWTSQQHTQIFYTSFVLLKNENSSEIKTVVLFISTALVCAHYGLVCGGTTRLSDKLYVVVVSVSSPSSDTLPEAWGRRHLFWGCRDLIGPLLFSL